MTTILSAEDQAIAPPQPLATAPAASIETLVLEPRRGWQSLNLGAVWRYRELLWFLAWRDVKLRYKQTVLGASWAVIQPLFTMIVFSIFFGQLAKIPSDGLPYPVFVLCALLPWQLFAYALTQSSNSVVAEQRLITKVYFPRLIIPLASVLSGLVDFLVAFVLLVGFMAWYGVFPGWAIVTIPLFALLALATALAVGLWLSALTVQYRDVRYTLAFLTQIWLFASPVAYPSSMVPAHWRMWYGLNPMAGVIEGFRWALLDSAASPGPMLGVSVVTVAVLLVGGLFYFRRMERGFADVVEFMSDVAIRVENLGKQYRLGTRENYRTLRDAVTHVAQAPWRWLKARQAPAPAAKPTLWALQDVSFKVPRGEVVGIIGRNGAGKSTLLKILSQITEPTVGKVHLSGRVGSLLEVGTGFHPELTGRENIFLNGAILGMRRAEILRKFNDIVAFAEVERFLDTQVKHYSSGMYTRLAFAVAAHLEPEILIVDEVLAVGDVEFQRKCLGKMGEVAKGGRTVLFVSHNMGAIQALCHTVIRLAEGQVASTGSPAQEVLAYLSSGVRNAGVGDRPLGPELRLAEFGFEPASIPTGSAARFRVKVQATADVVLDHFAGLIYNAYETRVGILDLRVGNQPYRMRAGQQLTVRLTVQRIDLVPGTYKLGLFLGSGLTLADFTDLATFEMVASQRGPVASPYPESAQGIVAFETGQPSTIVEPLGAR